VIRRVAIVTGGASGIGRATAELLESEGADVAVLDLDGPIRVDVRDAVSVEAAVATVRRTSGPIDILVNAAGVPAGGPMVSDGYRKIWDDTMAVNLTGVMLMVRACLPDLLRDGSGRIVNVASVEGLAAGQLTSPYTVSKHGVIGLTRSLAVELGRSGVTANCVCPGATLTGMTEGIPEKDRDAYARRRIPVGRYGRPEEVAHMVVALTAPGAAFVNGAIIPVDGGQTAQL
jgi:3-oxoacyl-[acyl-carrier protein] reductase